MAASAALLVAGCNGPSSTTSVTSTSPAVHSIDSWQDWGRDGRDKLNRCDKTEFGCVNDQLGTLVVDGKKLPRQEKAGFAALFLAGLYQSRYSDYVGKSCGHGTVVDGCVTIATSMISIDNDLRPIVDHLADGTPAEGNVQKTIEDIVAGRPAS